MRPLSSERPRSSDSDDLECVASPTTFCLKGEGSEGCSRRRLLHGPRVWLVAGSYMPADHVVQICIAKDVALTEQAHQGGLLR